MSVEPRRIWFLTGTRSDYDLMSPVMDSLTRSGRARVGVIVGAVHLSPFHGSSSEQVREDGFEIVGSLETLLCGESWIGRSLSFGNLHNALAQLFAHRGRPDILCVAGDREEALAGALAGSFLAIPVAHFFGGDRCIASDVDEVFRPAISKLSHLHFAACEEHRSRLIRMGERPERVWAHGAASLDRLRETPDVSSAELTARLGFDVDRPFFLMIHHPSPALGVDESGGEMEILLRGVHSTGHPIVVSHPNSDPGNVAMRRVIDSFASHEKGVVPYANLPRDVFVSLYRRCSAIVGNSSSIAIESPFLKVPAILVGDRQNLRVVAGNTLRVRCCQEEIRRACIGALEDADFRARVETCDSPYGDGRAADRIGDTLCEVPLDRDLLLKTLPY